MKKKKVLILLLILIVSIITLLIVLSRTEYRNALLGKVRDEKKAATTVGTWNVSASSSDNVTATLDSDGILTISGTGAMKDYGYYEGTAIQWAPWNIYSSDINRVVINSGITKIGNCAFYNNYNITSASIPSTVKTIGENAFLYCENLTSATIPNGVISIGDQAFAGCKKMASVTIPTSVTTIGKLAFSDCDAITTVTIPSSVNSIGDGAFGNCSKLTTINVDSSNANYISDNGVLFNKNKTKLVQYPAGKSGDNYTVPSTVTSIANYAFYGIKYCQKVTIYRGVSDIGEYTFRFHNNDLVIRGYRNSYAHKYANAHSDITFEVIEEDSTGSGAYKLTVYPYGTIYKGNAGDTIEIEAPSISIDYVSGIPGDYMTEGDLADLESWTLSSSSKGSISSTTSETTIYTFGNGDGVLTATYEKMRLISKTRSGYRLEGWYTAATGGIKIGDAGDTVEITENMTLYGHWIESNEYILTVNPGESTYSGYYGDKKSVTAPTITVTYNYNGNGQANTSVTATFNNWTLANQNGTVDSLTANPVKYTFKEGNNMLKANYKSVSLPTPNARTGYNFDGWYTDANGGFKEGNAGANYEPTDNITLYAHWTRQNIEYTITLDMQGATSRGTDKIYETYGVKYSRTSGGDAMTTSANAITVPEKGYSVIFNYNGATGGNSDASKTATYTFGGYYTSTNGGGTQYIGTNGYLTSSASTTNFSSNGSLYAKWTATSVTLPTPTKTGYTFGGWYSDSSLTTSVGAGGANYTPTANVPLYAKWTQNTYTITLDNANSTTAGTSSVTEVYADGIYNGSNKMTTSSNPITVPQRKYTVTYNYNGSGQTNGSGTATYAFKGYYDGTTQMINGEGKITNNFTSTKYTEAKTLNAQWNDGTVILPTPASREGYIFKGWYTSANGGDKIGDGNNEYKPTETKTIYAHWEKGTNTQYKVEHYLQKIDGTYPNTPSETENKTGTTGGLTVAQAKIYPGYIAQSFNQEEIKGDGTTIIKIRYNRSTNTPYTVKHYLQNLDGEGYTIDNTATEQKAGKTGAQTEAEAREYVGFTVQNFEQSEINGDGTTVIEIYYNRNTDTKYTVKYYLQNLEDDEYTQDEDATEIKEGVTGAETEAEEKEYEGFIVQDFNQEEIQGDESTAVKIYYNRIIRNVTFKNYDGTVLEEKRVKNEGSVEYTGVEPTREVDGYIYEFTGWDEELEDITEDIEVTAEFSQEIIVYTIRYNLNNEIEIRETTEEEDDEDNNEEELDGDEYDEDEDNDEDDERLITSLLGRTIASVGESISIYKDVAVEGVEFERENPTTYTVETEDFTLCNPTAQGYTFAGWKLAGEEDVEEEVTIRKGSTGNRIYETVWRLNDDTPYRVEHYIQQEDGEYPEEPDEVEELEGATLSEVRAIAKEYEGYELDEEESTMEGIIKGDGSLVLRLYYKEKPEEPEPEPEEPTNTTNNINTNTNTNTANTNRNTNTNTNNRTNTTNSNITTKTYSSADNTTSSQIIPKTGTISILVVTAILGFIAGIVWLVKNKE